MNALGQMVAMFEAARERLLLGHAESCRWCFGRRVLYDVDTEVQIAHDRACPAAGAPIGSQYAAFGVESTELGGSERSECYSPAPPENWRGRD